MLRITAIVATYNEADIIGQTVGDLVGQSIHVHILDNHSDDGTVEALQQYTQSGRVHIETFPPNDIAGGATCQFALTRLMERKQQLARELDADWFINHDADEFRESPWQHTSLRDGIEHVDRWGYNAIDFTVLNFWPTHDRFDPAIDIRDTFPHYEVGQAWDRVQVRCWKKADDIELVSSAGHDARFASRRVFPIHFLLRHYPIRSQAHGTRKVFEERKPRFVEAERQRGWHVQYDALSSGHLFLRDPATLTAYDPERVRVEGLMRDIDSLQLEIATQQQYTANLVTQVESQVARAERLAAEVAEGARRVERLAAEVAGHLCARVELQSHIDDLERQNHGLGQRNHALEHLVRDLGREIDDLRTSRSWTLTAPLRAVWRLLGRR